MLRSTRARCTPWPRTARRWLPTSAAPALRPRHPCHRVRRPLPLCTRCTPRSRLQAPRWSRAWGPHRRNSPPRPCPSPIRRLNRQAHSPPWRRRRWCDVPAASSALPTLSTVQAWDTTHLTSAAQDWTSKAKTWESAFTDLYRQTSNPGGASWSGAAADAALLRAHSDRATVLTAVDRLHGAAASARSGALELDGARQRVLSAVTSAQSAGYTVS